SGMLRVFGVPRYCRSCRGHVMKRVPLAPAVPKENPSHFRRLRSRFAASALGLLVLGAGAGQPAGAQGWPAGISAEYEVSYNGFSIGSFTFKAEAEQQSYTLTGNASLSMLLGAISWTGDIRSFG